jgi:hypothetical protein
METDTLRPDQIMMLAEEGRLSKRELADLLAIDQRHAFLDACAEIEKGYTEKCAAKNEPCLESGCSAVGEICLQPLLHAGSSYHKACAAAWLPIFSDPKKRAH